MASQPKFFPFPGALSTPPDVETCAPSNGIVDLSHHLLSLTNHSDTCALLSDGARGGRIGSPRPNAGEGPGGEGDLSLLNQLPKPGSGSASQNTRENTQLRWPPHPYLSPTLGRGGPNSLWVLQSRRPSSLYFVILNSKVEFKLCPWPF